MPLTRAILAAAAIAIALAAITSCSGKLAPSDAPGPRAADAGAGPPPPPRPIGEVKAPPPTDGPNSGDCPGPFTETPAIPPFSPAAATCTEADLSTLASLAPTGKGSWAPAEAAVRAKNDACASCLFGKWSDAEWRAIVYVGSQGQAFVDYGACFARSPGGSDACGAAVERQRLCVVQVCNLGTCASEEALAKCVALMTGPKGHCFGDAVGSACGAAYADLDARCATPIDVARALCASP